MGCGQSSSGSSAAILFPPERHCTDRLWIIIFAIFAFLSASFVIYCGATLNDFLAYFKGYPEFDWRDYWRLVGVSSGFALLFTLIITGIMQWLTRITIYAFMGLGTALLIGAMAYLWYEYAENLTTSDLYAAVITTIALVVWVCMLIYAIKTIELVLDLYQIAAQITFDLPAILVVSVLGFIAGFIGLIISLGMLGIVGAARLENDANPEGTNQKRVLLNCLVALVIFVGLWWQSFIIGCTKFVIGYGVGTWYFTIDKKNLNRPVKDGVKFLVSYHFGTILFGSFVMALIQFIKWTLNYLRKMKSENNIMNAIATLAICLISCCQSLWDILSTNAYYVTAMFGLPFCSSLKLGHDLTNLGVTTIFYIVGSIMVVVGVFVVTVCTTLITDMIVEPLANRLLTYAIIAFVSCLISSIIMTVYSTITRALYICVCVDVRQSPSQPFTNVPAIANYIEKTHTAVLMSQNMV